MVALSTNPTSTAVASIPSTKVTRPSVRSTGLPRDAPTLALPAARENITTAVTAVQAMPSGEWCGWNRVASTQVLWTAR